MLLFFVNGHMHDGLSRQGAVLLALSGVVIGIAIATALIRFVLR